MTQRGISLKPEQARYKPVDRKVIGIRKKLPPVRETPSINKGKDGRRTHDPGGQRAEHGPADNHPAQGAPLSSAREVNSERPWVRLECGSHRKIEASPAIPSMPEAVHRCHDQQQYDALGIGKVKKLIYRRID